MGDIDLLQDFLRVAGLPLHFNMSKVALRAKAVSVLTSKTRDVIFHDH